jgi:hypothetical protein
MQLLVAMTSQQEMEQWQDYKYTDAHFQNYKGSVYLYSLMQGK